MAHSLGLAVVAEGVEDDTQLNILRNLECDEVQGFYYSRPLPAEEFERLAREALV
jgi:EAL domain-containing protein (putative c-di-GMP-specific phosphodiesterase class I)